MFFDEKNKIKYLSDPMRSLDYTISDNIFSNYVINQKKRFFYFFRNRNMVDASFKLTKRDNLKFKFFNFFYLYDYYNLLNNNYNNLLYKCY